MFDLFHFLHSSVPGVEEVVHAIFYMHQIHGTYAGMCACDNMHQMEKTAINFSKMICEFSQQK